MAFAICPACHEQKVALVVASPLGPFFMKCRKCRWRSDKEA